MRRSLIRTAAFDEFYDSVPNRVQEKIDYALQIMSTIPVVSTKFVKKLENTEFYELRVSAGDEYRVILYTLDKDSFMESGCVLLLNGFKKKSVKDYKGHVAAAEKILDSLSCKDDKTIIR